VPPVGDAVTTTRREIPIALAITAVALTLRLFRLDHQSYWYDESLSVLAARLPLGDIARHQLQQAQQYTYPPLYTYALHAWFGVFGSTALAGRLFSAVFGSAAVLLLFVLVRRLSGGAAGLLAAALFAVSQIGVQYSQETRAYAFLFVLAIGAGWLIDVALMERRASAWYGFCALSAALALTHYHALWVLVALWGYALSGPLFGLKALPLRWWIVGLVLCLVLVFPWLIGGGLSALFGVRDSRPEMPSYFRATWRTLDVDVLGSYNNARWSGLLSAPALRPRLAGFVLYTLPALLAVSPLLLLLARRRSLGREERALILLGVTALLTMAGPVALAVLLRDVPYDIRYTSPGIGFYCGLVAIGAMRLRPNSLRWAAIALMLAFGLLSLRANYFMPYKENWRDSLAWLAEEARPQDIAVFVPYGSPPNTWSVYHPDRSPPAHARLEEVLERKPAAGRVWLLAYGRVEWAAQRGREAAAELQRNGYTLVDRREYHWVDASIWERRP